MENIFLHEFMTKSVCTVNESATLGDVLSLMQQHVYSCIVVVNDRTPVGIITERDLVKVLRNILSSKIDEKKRVNELMSKPPVCMNEGDTLFQALVITQTRKIRHLPVVNDHNHLVGLVTQTDIAQTHFTAVERYREIIEREIRDRTKDVVEANEELKAMALQDSMLEIGNRRAMEVDTGFTHANWTRYNRAYSCALVDVDYFKKYNDHYGHQAGDEVLKKVAKHIKECLRGSDRIYRYGGEEFFILLPETNIYEASLAITRIIKSVHELKITHELSHFGCVTISSGISAVVKHDEWRKVIKEADEYLYEAKGQGRNRACWSVEEAKEAQKTYTSDRIKKTG